MASQGKMKLYHTKNLRSSRCTWLIEELEVQDDFEIIDYNPYSVTDTERESYLSDVHFHGTVPALVLTDGTVMVEGVAINLYLAEKYNFLPPENKKAEYYSWSVYASSTLDHALKALYVQLHHTEESKRNDYVINNAKTRFNQFAERFEKFISNKQYICGDSFSAADINLGFCLPFACKIQNGFLLDGRPNIKAYLERLMSRPSFSRGMFPPGDSPAPPSHKPTLQYVFT